MNRLQESGAGAESNPEAGPSGATPAPPKSIFILEAEAVEATLKFWLGLGLPSAVRVATMAMNHLQQHANQVAKQ